jgi:hypothetical protein
MSCNTMRDLEYEREQEAEQERKRKKKRKELEAKQKELEKRRREKAEATIRDQAQKLQWLLKTFHFHPGVFHMYRPGSKDKVEITILEDGRVRVDSPGVISQANHPSMDAFMANLRDILKGKWRTVKQYATAGHTHSHAEQMMHTHSHGHGH